MTRLSDPAPIPPAEALCLASRNPQTLFIDPELRSAVFDHQRGRALTWRGRFALTVRAQTHAGESLAVRAFLKGTGPRATYRSLARAVANAEIQSLCPATWLDEGLRSGSTTYPIVKMFWAPGRDLRNTLLFECTEPRDFDALARAWRALCRELHSIQFAHGDIQADNVIVENRPDGRPVVRLIDYDSVWLPGLDVVPQESGHPAYQHPARQWGRGMECFTSTLVYLSLRALAVDPELTAYAKASDGLLFSTQDLRLTRSEIWQHLASGHNTAVASLADLLRTWLQSNANMYASLEEALADV